MLIRGGSPLRFTFLIKIPRDIAAMTESKFDVLKMGTRGRESSLG